MITTGTKWFVGLGAVSYVLAAAYGWSTGGNGLGPLSMGWKGAVGDHFGYGVLIVAAVLALYQAFTLTAWRDADPQAQAEVAGVDVAPVVRPAGISYWPALSAFGLGLGLIGLVSEPVLVVFGLIVVGAALVEWTVQTWSDHATGDPAANRAIRNRIMNPIEVPVAGVLAVGLVIISASRLLLAVSETSSVVAAGVIATVVLFGGAAVAARPRLGSNAIVALLLLGAAVVIGLGVAGGVAGEREIHHEGGEEEGSEGEASEGAAPRVVLADTAAAADAEGAR
jgi:hypothetical protein